MSQFILYKEKNIQKVLSPQKELFKQSSFFDSLCIESKEIMIENVLYEHTPLFEYLNALLKKCDEIILWYGSDYDDLDLIYDENQFLQKVKDSLLEESLEIYIHYKKK